MHVYAKKQKIGWLSQADGWLSREMNDKEEVCGVKEGEAWLSWEMSDLAKNGQNTPDCGKKRSFLFISNT